MDSVIISLIAVIILFLVFDGCQQENYSYSKMPLEKDDLLLTMQRSDEIKMPTKHSRTLGGQEKKEYKNYGKWNYF